MERHSHPLPNPCPPPSSISIQSPFVGRLERVSGTNLRTCAMARIHFTSGDNNTNVSKPVKRMRWATTRKPGESGAKKRLSLLQRMPKMHGSSHEEKSGELNGNGQVADGSPMGEQQHQGESQGRKIYVNRPLPPEAKSEDGHIIAQYARNKIRTAKYTALSFVPKNLWFQFHNIANIYFLFIVILSVCQCSPRSPDHCLTCADFQHLWRLQSRAWICALDFRPDSDCR